MPTELIQTYPERKQLELVRADLAVQVNATAKNGFAIQQGDVVGKITTDGKIRRRSRTTVGATPFATNSPTGTVADASIFTAGDVLKDAAGNTVGTIAAGGVNTATNTITLTGNATTAVATGAAVMASDGSQTAQGIADKDSDGNGDTSTSVFIGGFLDESKLRGLDATAKTELGGASVAGGVFKF